MQRITIPTPPDLPPLPRIPLPPSMMPGPCSAATSGNGYWTCDQGGCSDCRNLARDADDDNVFDEMNDTDRED